MAEIKYIVQGNPGELMISQVLKDKDGNATGEEISWFAGDEVVGSDFEDKKTFTWLKAKGILGLKAKGA